MYPACLWSVAPGHDGYSHAPVLITAIGLEGQFWVQAEGASLDCSAIFLARADPVGRNCCQPSSMVVGSEGRRRRSSSLAEGQASFHSHQASVGDHLHAIRASLFATATAATLRCMRVSRLFIQGPNGWVSRRTWANTDRDPWMNNRRRYWFPRLLIPRSLAFPPVEYCLGTRPSHAENSRPRANADPLPTAATIALATRAPTPGTSTSLRQLSSCLAICSIAAVASAIWSSTLSTRATAHG
jgi:hypothetical protein